MMITVAMVHYGSFVYLFPNVYLLLNNIINFLNRYHIELVKLLAYCTMGKNVYTEIKCHSLLPLDDIVAMVSHSDCIPEVYFLSLPLNTFIMF